MPYVAVYDHRVRSYELDIYGHVNNAVYMQWLEHGRSKLLQDKGLTYTTIVQAWNVRLLTVATKIDFRAQLGLDAALQIRTCVKRMGNSSVTFDQKIVRCDGAQETVAAECETTICFTEPSMKTPCPIPREFRALYG